MQAHPPLWTYTDTQAPGHMHKFTWFTHIDTSVQARTHTGTRWRSAQWSQSYRCFYVLRFPLSLSFFTPPVTMCHHLPPQRWSQCYLQTVLRKIQGQKSALGIWTIEQKFDAHTMFDIWIHFCVAQRYILPCKDNHFVLNYLCKCCSFILLTDDDKHNLVACVKKITYCIVRYNWMYSFHMLPVYHKPFQWL